MSTETGGGNPTSLSSEARFAFYKEAYFATAERQFQYGKWVLASLLTVHAGSLLAISQAGSKTGALYAACGPLLIYGVGISLIAGGMAWFNFTVAMNVYALILVHIRENKEYKVSRKVRVTMGITVWGTPLIAAIALGLFFLAAARATNILHP